MKLYNAAMVQWLQSQALRS